MPELIVAMALFSVLMAVVVSSVVMFSRTFTKERASNDSTNIAAVGINELTRVIRSGTTVPLVNETVPLPVFVDASPEQVTLHAFIDTDSMTPKPVKVRFHVDPATRDLVETRWESYPNPAASGYWLFHTTPSMERVIARKIVAPAPGEDSLFRYFRIDEDTRQEVEMTLHSGAIPTANLNRIAAVEIAMKVQADITERAEPVMVLNRVGIPNLGVSRLGIT